MDIEVIEKIVVECPELDKKDMYLLTPIEVIKTVDGNTTSTVESISPSIKYIANGNIASIMDYKGDEFHYPINSVSVIKITYKNIVETQF